MTVSISFHTASRSTSLIRSRNGRISGGEFRLCSIAAATEGNRWGAWHDFHRHVPEAGRGE